MSESLDASFVGVSSYVRPFLRGGFIQNRCTVPKRRWAADICYQRKTVPQAVWVEKRASVHVESATELVYTMYSDLDAMPKFSPWLKSVRVLSAGTDPHGTGAISLWTLAARGLTFSWRSRITSVRPNEVIVWESLSGLPNRGNVTFTRVPGDETTKVCLTVAFNVPRPVAAILGTGFVGKYVENTLLEDLKRFRILVLREKRRRRTSSIAAERITFASEEGRPRSSNNG